jgi:hypothetical protein
MSYSCRSPSVTDAGKPTNEETTMPKLRVDRPTREDMMKCVVFHADITPNNDTYFDSNLPGNVRTAYHYLTGR